MTPVERSPRISVVLATRNRAGVLARAIDSVLSQSLTDLELIVVSDASTDETASLLRDVAAVDPRVRPLLLNEPHGAPAARNVGIGAARGEYLALLDDDAQWLPHKLEAQMEALANAEQTGVVYCSFVRVRADGCIVRVGSAAAAEGDAWRVLLARTFVDTSCLVVRTDILRAIGGFDEGLPRLQDWDLALRLARVTRFAYVPEVLVRSHETPGSISSQPERLIAASRRFIEKVIEIGATPAELAASHRALGHALMVGGAPREGRQLLRRALRLQPLSLIGGGTFLLAALGERAYGRVNAARLALARKAEDG